ncbi:MAG: hypothetical protein HFI64_03840 [Lachnospiraceae bacterium]|nr:hypothetical protein [Lachnospiraceae bacterium]
MKIIAGNYDRTTELMKLSKAHASTANEKLESVEEKPSGEFYSDMPVVKLEISREGKESLKSQVYCKPVHNNLEAFYGEAADWENLLAREKRVFKEEQERLMENEEFLENLEEEAMTALRDLVMQYVRESLSDVSKMFGKLDC